MDAFELTQLYNYYFAWGEASEEAAIALGYGSLYNHSYTPNAKYRKDFDNNLLKYICIRDIQKDEEITINYNFDPEDKTPVWFELASQNWSQDLYSSFFITINYIFKILHKIWSLF